MLSRIFISKPLGGKYANDVNMDNAFQDLKYPWMVAILDVQTTYSEDAKGLPQACGGTLGEAQKQK